MKSKLPIPFILIAIFQFICPLIWPPFLMKGFSIFVVLFVLLIFALLGFNLLRRKAWSRIATICVQGFNIIIGILIAISHAVQGGKAGNPINWELLVPIAISLILSGIVLYYIDLPDIQVLMQ